MSDVNTGQAEGSQCLAIHINKHTELVIGKGGNDPRLEDDASAQIFNRYMQLVIGGYAN
jgi:hypothetical protein